MIQNKDDLSTYRVIKFRELMVKYNKLLKLCLKNNKIYNGEFKRLLKFFKGAYNWKFYIHDDLYSAFFSQECNGFKKYESDFWNSFFNKKVLKVKSLKPTIITGRRPSNEDPKHMESLIQRSLKSDLGTCGACHRHIEIEHGVIYDHGFKKYGYRASPCVGSNFEPWERSTSGKLAYIKQLEKMLMEIQSNKPTQEKLDKIEPDNNNWVYFNSHLYYYPMKLERVLKDWEYDIEKFTTRIKQQKELVDSWQPQKTLREIAQERVTLMRS